LVENTGLKTSELLVKNTGFTTTTISSVHLVGEYGLHYGIDGKRHVALTTCSAPGDNPMVSSDDCGGTTMATMLNFPLNQLETINGLDDLHRKKFSLAQHLLADI
jgi:hypothetical protein